jgi:hypothetical protein
MSTPKLFSVEVTRTWTATMEVLVWAKDETGAIKAAMDKEDLRLFDASDDGAEAGANAVDPKMLKKLPTKPDQLLLVPEPQRPGPFPPVWRVVHSIEEFVAFLSPEDAERLQIEPIRIAAIERNNGQIPLLEVADVQP